MTDVLVTVALVAVVGGITAGKYLDLRGKMSTKVLNSNTMEVNKVFQIFQTLGCRFSSISNSGQSPEVQAAVLTEILQNPAASGAKSQEGLSVAQSSTDMVLVPFPNSAMTEDGRIRIAFNPTNGSIVTANSGLGFIPLSVSQNADLLAQSRGTPSNAAIAALVSQFSAAQKSATNGYAYNNNSLINEDTAIYGGPMQTMPVSAGSNLSPSASDPGTKPVASILANTSTINFGNVTIGSHKQSELTILNSDASTENLSISSIDTPNGISINITSAVIRPGDSQTFSIIFAPLSMGQFSGNVIIKSNAANTPNGLTINCTGTGVSPQNISVEATAALANVGESVTLTATGGHNKYTWSSSDANDSFTYLSEDNSKAVLVLSSNTGAHNISVYNESGNNYDKSNTASIIINANSLQSTDANSDNKTSGGTVSYHGVQTFSTAGSTTWTVPSGVTSIDVLAVGGGGPCEFYHNTGGGAGGIVYKTSVAVTAGETLYITVGDGGDAFLTTNGDPSALSRNPVIAPNTALLYAFGGGAGGGASAGNSGGSGGGGGYDDNDGIDGGYAGGAANNTYDNVANAGGNGDWIFEQNDFAGGGGGGAGTAGENGNALLGIHGRGGDGKVYSITGSAVYYGGGGSMSSSVNPWGTNYGRGNYGRGGGNYVNNKGNDFDGSTGVLIIKY
jgi:hypothetical protein